MWQSYFNSALTALCGSTKHPCPPHESHLNLHGGEVRISKTKILKESTCMKLRKLDLKSEWGGRIKRKPYLHGERAP